MAQAPVISPSDAKSFVRPNRSPEELAELVSCLSHQQQAEMMYELILYSAIAARDTRHEALNECLAELEDLAMVYTDPEKRRELQDTVRETVEQISPGAA